MQQHYATATIARLVDAANAVSTTRDSTTVDQQKAPQKGRNV